MTTYWFCLWMPAALQSTFVCAPGGGQGRPFPVGKLLCEAALYSTQALQGSLALSRRDISSAILDISSASSVPLHLNNFD